MRPISVGGPRVQFGSRFVNARVGLGETTVPIRIQTPRYSAKCVCCTHERRDIVLSLWRLSIKYVTHLGGGVLNGVTKCDGGGGGVLVHV